MLSLPVIFSAVFACIGLVLSISIGIIVQNEIFYVIWIGFICMILAGTLGFAVYKILELKVPEILSILRGEFSAGDESELGDFSEESVGGSSLSEESGLDSTENADVIPDRDSTKVFGDHILVNKVKIKNEPKLIAQAIQTMLSRDN